MRAILWCNGDLPEEKITNAILDDNVKIFGIDGGGDASAKLPGRFVRRRHRDIAKIAGSGMFERIGIDRIIGNPRARRQREGRNRLIRRRMRRPAGAQRQEGQDHRAAQPANVEPRIM